MPRGDRTGPWGAGPMTGRGAGYCASYDTPGFADAAPDRPFIGRGGRGRRNRFFANGLTGWERGGMGYRPFRPEPQGVEPEEEIRRLEQQADYLEKTLSGIRDRIGRMKTDSGS